MTKQQREQRETAMLQKKLAQPRGRLYPVYLVLIIGLIYMVGALSFALLVPGFVLALLVLWRRTGETRGMDLNTVTGTEWD